MTREIREDVAQSKQDWATQTTVYDGLNAEYGFTIDLCAEYYNTKHPVYVSPAVDLLTLSGRLIGHTGFLNPPYKWIAEMIAFCRQEREHGLRSALLLPASVNSKWFHTHAKYGVVDFFDGRISYDDVTPAHIEIVRLISAFKKKPSAKLAHKMAYVLAELVDLQKSLYTGPAPYYGAFCEALELTRPYNVKLTETRADVRQSGASFDSMVVTFDPRIPLGPHPVRTRNRQGRLV